MNIFADLSHTLEVSYQEMIERLKELDSSSFRLFCMSYKKEDQEIGYVKSLADMCYLEYWGKL